MSKVYWQLRYIAYRYKLPLTELLNDLLQLFMYSKIPVTQTTVMQFRLNTLRYCGGNPYSVILRRLRVHLGFAMIVLYICTCKNFVIFGEAALVILYSDCRQYWIGLTALLDSIIKWCQMYLLITKCGKSLHDVTMVKSIIIMVNSTSEW